jgi:endonuclease/exonuclease/phosphatase family metal-dependent hydrolase
MKRRHFLTRLSLAASLPWFGRAALAAAEAAPQPDSGSHKILTCNVRVDAAADGKTGNGWADRRDLCAEVMRGQRADVICLQECQEVHFKYLKSRLPEFETFAQCKPDAHGNPLNAILFSRARYELVSAGGFWLSEKPHVAGSKSWDSAEARFVNWVQLRERGAGKEFRVWNTHLDHIGQVAREKGAELIVQAGAALPSGFPQLLTGDFNANAAHPAIKLVAAGGWTDTYSAVHGPEDPGYTFHGFLGPNYGEQKFKGKPGTRIDWIWCRGPVKVLGAEVIREGRNGRYPSDHYFMSAVVGL